MSKHPKRAAERAERRHHAAIAEAHNRAKAEGIAALAETLTGFSLTELRERCAERDISAARQALMLALIQGTRWSLPRVALFLHRDHTTVMHGRDAAIRACNDPTYATLVKTLTAAKPFPVILPDAPVQPEPLVLPAEPVIRKATPPAPSEPQFDVLDLPCGKFVSVDKHTGRDRLETFMRANVIAGSANLAAAIERARAA